MFIQILDENVGNLSSEQRCKDLIHSLSILMNIMDQLVNIIDQNKVCIINQIFNF